MMASLDGRIDCDMTSHLGSKGYYEALEVLKIDTTVEGKVTALHHYASGPYTPIDPCGRKRMIRTGSASFLNSPRASTSTI